MFKQENVTQWYL